MKKTMLRGLSRIMAVIMLLVTVPLPELKVLAAEEYGVWVGDQQFTSEKKTIYDKKGTGTAEYDNITHTLTFNDFEGVEGEHEVGSGEYALVCTDSNYTFSEINIAGNAVLEAQEQNHNGIRSDGVNINILAGSDISVTTESYSVYSPADKLCVYGKLRAKTTGQTDVAVNFWNVETYDGAELDAEAGVELSKGIFTGTLRVNGGTVNAISVGANEPAIHAVSLVEVQGGTFSAVASGSESVGIETPGAVYFAGGDITVSGMTKAVYVDATSGSISVDPSMYFVDPVGGKVSTDGKKILKADDSEAKFVHLVKPENYGLWVGNTQVNNLNKDAIPGIEGGGSASYDPENKVLSFNGTVTGIENEYDDGTTKALICATDDLCIRGAAAFEKNGLNAGIYMDATDKELRIEGDVSLKSDADTLVNNNKGSVVISGKLKLENNDSYALAAKKLVQESGSLEVHSKCLSNTAVFATEALDVYSGTFSVVNDPDDPSANSNAVGCPGVVLISGGSFTVDNGKASGGMYTGNDFIVLGGNVEIKNETATMEALNVAGEAKLTGGKIKITAAGLSTALLAKKDVTIENAEVEINGGYHGIQTLKKLEILSGVLKAKGGVQAINTTDGLVYDEAEISLTKPADGLKGATTITDASGTTPALEVWLEGGAILYPVWVGSTQVSSTNKTDIFGDGKASYDPDTNTLSFTGEEITVEGTSTVDGFTAKIFSTNALTIKGNVQINDLDLQVGIGAKGKLVLDGNFQVSTKNWAVLTTGSEFAPIVINGKLEASSYMASPVDAAEDIIVAGDGLFVNASSINPAVKAGKKLILKSGVLDAQGNVKAIETKSGIQIPTAYTITIPEGGKPSADAKTVMESDGVTPAKRARIENVTLYDLWVGETHVNSNNAENIPGVSGGTASYDPESKTLTFTGDECTLGGVNMHDAYGAQIYAGDELTIEGKVKLENEEAVYGIYTKGKLNINGDVTAKGISHGVYAENSALLVTGTLNAASDEKRAIEAADITVNGGKVTANGTTAIIAKDIMARDGELRARGDKTAVDAKSFVLDGGSVNASVSNDGTKTVVVKLEEKLEILSGDAVLTCSGGANFNVLSAGGGAFVKGGSLKILDMSTGEHKSSKGLKDTALSISGGNVNIEMQDSMASKAIYYEGVEKDVRISSGRLVISGSTPGQSVYCGDFEVSGGTVIATPVQCRNFTVSGGTVEVKSETGASAIVASAFHMEGGKLTADSTSESNTPAIVTGTGKFTLGADVQIVEPAGGRICDDASRIADAEGNEAMRVVLAGPGEAAAEEEMWNLFESDERSFEIAALSSGSEVENKNAKSAKFYDAKLNGNTISVKLKSGVNRKQAAKPANTVLEFDLGSAGVAVYVIPVQYVKPVFKPVTKSVTIRDGAETTVKTQILVKTEYGNYEACDLSGMTVKYGSIDAVGDSDGYVSFKTPAAVKGAKLTIDKPGVWESPIALKFSVKAVSKDVLSVDLDGRKAVFLNKNVSGQVFEFPLSLNGAAVSAETAEITKGAEVAEITADSKLRIAAKADTKAGNYTVTVAQKDGKARLNIKVKVSEKALGQAVSLKLKSRYDVVSGQKMLVEPVFKEAEAKILSVASETEKFTAELDGAGNILIDYSGERNVKKLNLGDIKLKLKFEGVSEDVSFTLGKVKAKKTMPKVRSAAVTLNKDAAGEVKACVNVVCSYRDGAGKFHTIVPADVNVDLKKVKAQKNALDPNEIDILDLEAKSGSVKLKLSFAGGAEKKLTIKVKKAK
ncbi:MAG: hypothetical protein K5697_10405 [Lachnospiraceae bacterium]|nr:hypothetical protein [Lachnospiraceae bacterium]